MNPEGDQRREQCQKQVKICQSKFNVPTLSSHEWLQQQEHETWIVVDVRTAPERKVSMIRGAKTLTEFDRDCRAGTIPDDAKVAFYCTIGFRSGIQATKYLRQNTDVLEGRVFNLDGIVAFSQAVADRVNDNNSNSDHPRNWLIEPGSGEPATFVHTFGFVWNFVDPEVFSGISYSLPMLLVRLLQVGAITSGHHQEDESTGISNHDDRCRRTHSRTATKVKEREEDPLLQLIPRDRMTRRQKALLADHSLPMYKMLREPAHLDEFDWDKYGEMERFGRHFKRQVCVTLGTVGKVGNVPFHIKYGDTNAAIAETATFFWSLKDQVDGTAWLQIEDYGNDDEREPSLSLETFLLEQLVRILDANPTRRIDFAAGILNAEQSVVLATRSYPLNLFFGEDFFLLDNGTAFIDALEMRQTPFGSLGIQYSDFGTPLSLHNLQRLCNLDLLGKLEIIIIHTDEEADLLPFSAKVNTLDYSTGVDEFHADDFDTTDIVAKDLRVEFCLQKDIDLDWHLILFLNRVALLWDMLRN